MAHVKNSALLQGVKGALGELVIKQYGNRTVITKKPDMSRVKKSALQKIYRDRFKEAVVYARGVLRDPKKKAAFAKKLKDGQTVFNAALSHYLKELKRHDSNHRG